MLLILAAIAQAAATLATLDLRWLVTLDTPPAAPPAYDSGAAYVPLRDQGLAAIDLERGHVRWRSTLTTAVSPAAGDGLAFLALDGRVEALGAATGGTRWQTRLPGRLVSVTWDTGWLLCANDTGDLAALRASDGELVWRTSLGAPPVVAPAPGLDRVYLGLEGGQVVALDLTNGRRAWERTLPGRITGLRSVDGQLIAGTTGNAVFSLDLVTGRQRWRWRVGGDVSGQAAGDERHVYFTARDNVLRAVDLRSGNLRWTAELPTRPVGGPQVVPGLVLVPMSTAVALFDPASGAALGTMSVSGELGVSPHIRQAFRPTGARLVTLTRDGRLQGFGARFEAPPAPLDALPGQVVAP